MVTYLNSARLGYSGSGPPALFKSLAKRQVQSLTKTWVLKRTIDWQKWVPRVSPADRLRVQGVLAMRPRAQTAVVHAVSVPGFTTRRARVPALRWGYGAL